MRPLRYSINITLDGRCDHRAMATDEELHRHWDLERRIGFEESFLIDQGLKFRCRL